jgi:hypothetical protein
LLCLLFILLLFPYLHLNIQSLLFLKSFRNQFFLIIQVLEIIRRQCLNLPPILNLLLLSLNEPLLLILLYSQFDNLVFVLEHLPLRLSGLLQNLVEIETDVRAVSELQV